MGKNNKIVKIVLMLLLCLCKTQFILAYCIGLCIGTVYSFYKQQPFVPSFLNVDTHPYEKIEVWDGPPAVPYSYIFCNGYLEERFEVSIILVKVIRKFHTPFQRATGVWFPSWRSTLKISTVLYI